MAIYRSAEWRARLRAIVINEENFDWIASLEQP
jgi:hypothetical protein